MMPQHGGRLTNNMFCKVFSEPQPQLPGTELEQFPQCPLYAHSAFPMSFIFAVAVSLHFAAPESAQQNAGDSGFSTPSPVLLEAPHTWSCPAGHRAVAASPPGFWQCCQAEQLPCSTLISPRSRLSSSQPCSKARWSLVVTS